MQVTGSLGCFPQFNALLTKLFVPFEKQCTDLADQIHRAAPDNLVGLQQAADKLKQSKLATALNETKKTGELTSLATALNGANILHGKPGHNENLVNVIEFFFDQEKSTTQFNLNKDLILQAASVYGVCDLRAPTDVLTKKGPPTDQERAEWITPRANKSADIIRNCGSGFNEVANLLDTIRAPNRSPAAQLIDIIDQGVAMAAKPSFQDNGEPNWNNITKNITANSKKSNLNSDHKLMSAATTCLQNFTLNGNTLITRTKDLWVHDCTATAPSGS